MMAHDRETNQKAARAEAAAEATADEAKDLVSSAVELGDSIGTTLSALKRETKDRPLAAILVAAIVGYVFSKLLG
jgi:hypothetical protein